MYQQEKIDFLTCVRNTISSGWCQGHYAKNKFGSIVHYNSKDAECFCLSGGLLYARFEKGFNIDTEFSMSLRAELGEYAKTALHIELSNPKSANFAHFNDHPSVTQVDVLAFLDHCILKVKEGLL